MNTRRRGAKRAQPFGHGEAGGLDKAEKADFSAQAAKLGGGLVSQQRAKAMAEQVVGGTHAAGQHGPGGGARQLIERQVRPQLAMPAKTQNLPAARPGGEQGAGIIEQAINAREQEQSLRGQRIVAQSFWHGPGNRLAITRWGHGAKRGGSRVDHGCV